MRRNSILVALAAAGVTAATMAAAPAFAASGTGPGDCTGTGPTASAPGTGLGGTGMGYGRRGGMGQGGMGQGGMGQGTVTAPSGTLTSAQRTHVAMMAEEEKLAHDLYVALAARYPGTVQFSRIANAETRHLTAVRTLMARYAIGDPTAGLAAGEFRTAAFQTMYDDLLAGATTNAAALAAGITVEKADIADLQTALRDLTAPDAVQVYGSLLSGSQRHLAAFGG